MKVIAVVICAIPFLTVASLVYAAPTVEVWNGPKMILGLPACGGRTADSNTLIIKDGGIEAARYHFCATAVAGTARIVPDNTGKSFVLLSYYTGHGTNVTVEHLAVFQVPPSSKRYELFPYLELITSAPAGPSAQWAYRYQVKQLSCGGLRFVFTLKIRVDYRSATVEGIPSERVRTIDVGVPLHCEMVSGKG